MEAIQTMDLEDSSEIVAGPAAEYFAVVDIGTCGIVVCTDSLHLAAETLEGNRCSGCGATREQAIAKAREEAVRIRHEAIVAAGSDTIRTYGGCVR
jgi:hypothetical protein